MNISRRRALGGLAALGLVPLLASCHGGTNGITVGSKDFTEENILGEMYAQLLEHHGLTVHRRLSLGGTQVAMAALQRGAIDLYPEYTGTALLVELAHAPIHDDALAYTTVAHEYTQRFALRWLDAAPLNDTQSIAMTEAAAAGLGVRTVSDFMAHAPQIRLAAVPEFLHRADGLPGLEKIYGKAHFQTIQIVDSGLKYQALAHGSVNAVVAFSTDGRIATDHLRLLTDDRKIWDAYHPAPVVRESTLRLYPSIPSILNPLAPTLTNSVMQQLNARVDGEKQDVAAVATAHLHAVGLL